MVVSTKYLFENYPPYLKGFLDSSVGKESACNAGAPGSIPGWGRSAGEGIGYPFQYSWASIVAQLVKNPPAMRKTWVWSLGLEDLLEKGKATHSSILAWKIQSMGLQRVGCDGETFTFHYQKPQASTGWFLSLYIRFASSRVSQELNHIV